MRVTSAKNCHCHTCDRDFHYLGITRHRAAHRDRREKCTITYTHGDTYEHDYTALESETKKAESSQQETKQ